jgi:hypothetical protein
MIETAAWEEKVLRSYLNGETLKQIPASRKKRLVVLIWLVKKFASEITYSEQQINEIITRYHPDCATLRRELITYQLMEREKGIYKRLPASLWKSEREMTKPANSLY